MHYNTSFNGYTHTHKLSLATHPLQCHLWPVQCSAAPSMLCRRSADRAAPAGSLSGRPVDTRHTGGAGGPETHKNIQHKTKGQTDVWTKAQETPATEEATKIVSLTFQSAYFKHLWRFYDLIFGFGSTFFFHVDKPSNCLKRSWHRLCTKTNACCYATEHKQSI